MDLCCSTQNVRLVDDTLCQQGANLADRVLQYRSQAHPLRKPRSAGRRPAVPSPHQPCLVIPEDQASHLLNSDWHCKAIQR